LGRGVRSGAPRPDAASSRRCQPAPTRNGLVCAAVRLHVLLGGRDHRRMSV
jgi:hypothetical protein